MYHKLLKGDLFRVVDHNPRRPLWISTAPLPYLQEVVRAHIDRFPIDGTKGRPEKVLEDITKNVSADLHEVLKEFWNRESIYCLGDIQLKHLYNKVMLNR